MICRGDWLARLLGAIDGPPEGAADPARPPVGAQHRDFFPHPLPAKITAEVLPPSTSASSSPNDPDLDEVYDHIARVMQEALNSLAAERRLPVIG